MILRRDTLDEALGEIEADRLTGASSIVVNLQWWSGLSIAEQEDYRLRADRARIELVARMGIMRKVLKRGWRPLVGATMITYRKSLLPFEKFRIRSRFICFDERDDG